MCWLAGFVSNVITSYTWVRTWPAYLLVYIYNYLCYVDAGFYFVICVKKERGIEINPIASSLTDGSNWDWPTFRSLEILFQDSDWNPANQRAAYKRVATGWDICCFTYFFLLFRVLGGLFQSLNFDVDFIFGEIYIYYFSVLYKDKLVFISG